MTVSSEPDNLIHKKAGNCRPLLLCCFQNCLAEGVEQVDVRAGEYDMMVADRGLQEIVLADLDRLLSNLHGNLSSAETVLIRIAGKLSLTTERPP